MHVYATRGLKGLWAGFIPSTLGVAHGAVQFAIYEKMKHRRADQLGGTEYLSNWDFIYMSGGSKLLAGAITYPYQPIRARMQQYNAASQYNGLVDVLRKTWRNEGFLAFYKGYADLNANHSRSVGANAKTALYRIPFASFRQRSSPFLSMRIRRSSYRGCLTTKRWHTRRTEL